MSSYFAKSKALLEMVFSKSIKIWFQLWGNVETIKEDLKKTVGAGVKQIWKFEQAIASGRFSEL